jgi:hypothetical protein
MNEDNWEADDEYDFEHNNGNENAETPARRDASAAPNVQGFILP